MSDIFKDKLGLKYSEQFPISGIEEANIDLSLDTVIIETSTIIGTVVDASGAVEGATIKIFDKNGVPYRHTLSDTQGEFSFNNLPAGEYKVAATKHGYVMSLTKNVSLSAGDSIDLKFVIEKDLTVTLGAVAGIVSDMEHKALSNINVSMLDDKDNAVSITYSAADGEFAFYDIKDGTYTIVASSDGYRPSTPTIIIIKESSIVNLNIKLEVDIRSYNGTVSGIIRDSKKQVVANAFVGLYLVTTAGDAKSERLIATCKTNSVGAYLFGNVAAGEYIVKSKISQK